MFCLYTVTPAFFLLNLKVCQITPSWKHNKKSLVSFVDLVKQWWHWMPVSLQPCVDGFKSFGRDSNQELKISVWHFSATTQVSANMLIANLHVARICVIKWAVLPQTTHSEMARAPRSACEQWWKRAHENGSVSRTLCRVIDDDVLSVLSHSGGTCTHPNYTQLDVLSQ